MVRGSLERHSGLIVAASGEALLALTAGLGAALNVPLAGLGIHDRVAVEASDGEAALPNQENTPISGRWGGLREGTRLGRTGVRRGEGERCDERRPVLSETHQ